MEKEWYNMMSHIIVTNITKYNRCYYYSHIVMWLGRMLWKLLKELSYNFKIDIYKLTSRVI